MSLQVFRASICVQIDMPSTPCSTRPTPAHIYTMYMSTAHEVLGPAAPTHIPTAHAAQDCTSLHICPLCIPLCPCIYTPATPHTRLHTHAHGPAACAHMACSACAHSPPHTFHVCLQCISPCTCLQCMCTYHPIHMSLCPAAQDCTSPCTRPAAHTPIYATSAASKAKESASRF